MSLGGLRWLLVVWLCCLGGGAWADVGQPEQCVPRVLNVMAARADVGDLVDASARRPAAGWVPVTPPTRGPFGGLGAAGRCGTASTGTVAVEQAQQRRLHCRPWHSALTA